MTLPHRESASADSTRRDFARTMVAGAVAGLAGGAPAMAVAETPALLGGKPVRSAPFPSWPRVAANDDRAWPQVLHKGKWCRLDGAYASQFEKTWAKTLGASLCYATASGTTALFAVLNALDIGPGDEVIVPPYTFIATVNVVLLLHALPVFVDTDPETFQIDARKIEAAITPRTRAIMPVHLGGSPADLDAILDIASRHKLAVVEDACQAHLAEWKNRKVGTLGSAGCFSFQASKNLNCGEGGAIVSNDQNLMDRAESFCNNGRGTGMLSGYVRNGSNQRITEFQAALLNEQLTRLEAQAATRDKQARYLTRQLQDIPGIQTARLYPGVTRSAYHLYMARYDPEHFDGLPRAQFLKALQAEGVPCDGGYTPLNKEEFLDNTLRSRAFQRIYSASELDGYRSRNQCPANDALCQQAIWFFQTMLLGEQSDMDDIVRAVGKIRAHASELAHKA